MASFNLNGLANSFMPNIYISKITLEGASGALNEIAANKEAAIEAHIDKRSTGKGGWTGNPTAGDFTQSNKLVVTYSLLLETQDLFDEIGDFVDDIFKFLKVNIITLKGKKGKAAYQHFISKKDTSNFPGISLGELLSHLDTKKTLSGDPEWPFYSNTQLFSDQDFKFTSQALDNIIENSMSTSAVGQLGVQYKRDFIKQKYKHTLPDGRIIYKIPLQIKQEIAGNAFPSDLAAIAMCKLDMSSIMDELGDATGGDFYSAEEKYGRTASSVIIKDSLVPKQGMAFFISTDQNSDKFDHLMGTLWFGGVHKHDDRYMAGNVHDPDVSHPYLDYVLVDNQSVQDFRQITQLKKQIFNFEASKNTIFGGNYINNQLNQVVAADFSNLVCFGDLISSINTKRQTKLLFSIDWGKIIKKNCAMPMLLDKLANLSDGHVTQFLSQYGAPNIKSLKIYRKRVEVPRSNDSVNDTVRKLVYDGYPNIYYTGQLGNVNLTGKEPIIAYNPKVKSALAPVLVEDSIFGGSANSSHIHYYAFTDYDIQKISRGSFEYSFEVEIEDPTLNYFINSYVKINFAISQIKPMVSFVNGGHNPLGSSFGQNQLFNSHTGQFTQLAKTTFSKEGWDEIIASDAISGAITAVMDFAALAQNKPVADIGSLVSLLSVASGTPESFNVFSEILILMADKIKSVIDSYSTAPMPKTLAFGDDVGFEKVLGQVVSAAAQRTIRVEHFFKKSTEIVRTTHGDAGYEFLASTPEAPMPNRTTTEIGLKSISSGDYIHRSLKEFKKYFPNLNTEPINLPVKIPSYSGPKPNQKLTLNLMPSVGMHLKVPNGGTHLPRYIVDHESNNENEYWMVVNNILRYKLGLYGDTSSDNKLGYGPDDVIDSQTGIDAQMERILKEYQTLAYKGIYFPQASVLEAKNPVDLAASEKKLIGDVDGAPGKTIPWDNAKNNPLPEGVPFETELEGTAGMPEIIKMMQVPWAQNYGQEKLLLALINGTFIAPTVLDLKLGSFNPMLWNSKLFAYVNDIFKNLSKSSNAEDALLGTAKILQELPSQALALIANTNVESAIGLLNPADTEPNPDFQYFLNGGVPQLFEKPEEENSWEAIQNQNLKIDKFGQFWFDHMNVVEIQYLAGYEGVKNIPKPVGDPDPNSKRYEEVFNAAANSPIWKPLTVEKLQAINISITQASGPGSGLHLLCRLAKKRCDIFNTKAYDALEMPLYDEYFLITTQYQVEGVGSNTYIGGFPDENISAGSPGLQIDAPSIEGQGPTLDTAFEPMEKSDLDFSSGLPTGKQAPTEGPESQDSPANNTVPDNPGGNFNL